MAVRASARVLVGCGKVEADSTLQTVAPMRPTTRGGNGPWP
jgi:hypothetical protein